MSLSPELLTNVLQSIVNIGLLSIVYVMYKQLKTYEKLNEIIANNE